MILVLDNYDSFTWNLVQAMGELGAEIVVRRNDELAVEEVAALAPDRIVISPGPGHPRDAGITVEVIRRLGESTPILGVCLGHQAVGLAFGGHVTAARVLMHGKSSRVRHDGRGVFRGVREPFSAGRYHSLVVSEEEFPPELEITAWTSEDDTIMGLRHRTRPIHGVQFHPESVLTAEGRRILQNFLEA